MPFNLLTISDIINKHKGIPAILQCHGPSANNNAEAVHKFYDKNEAVVFGINEWHQFKNDIKPDYWLRSFPQRPSIESDYEYYNEHTKDGVTLLSCDVVDSSSLESAMENLTCSYLPFDLRHFNRQSCQDNFSKDPKWFLPRYFTFFPDCCNRKGRITLQEELKNYTNYNELYSPSTHTSAINMIAFAILMGCNPIYITGMDLDYNIGTNSHAELKKGEILPGTPGNSWSDWRRNWILRDFNIVNESAKCINTDIINLTHNTWYGIFEEGNI